MEEMLPIRLVHIPRFRSTRPVWLYHELRQLYGDALPNLELSTFTDIPAFRTSKPQWLLDMNPNGKVPTMAHGSLVMFEGGAICSYFLDKYDVDRLLLPKDDASVGMYYQMVSWCASTLDNLIATSSPINAVLGKDAPRPMDDVVTNKKYFDEIFVPFFNKQLAMSGGPYLCGANFTAADVILGFFAMQSRDKMVPTWIEKEANPALHAYVDLLLSRPGLQKAIGPCA